MSLEKKAARILIVDDTLQNIQVLGTVLREQEYQINVAQNGLQALEMVGKVTPDLILLDVMMPEMDGFETCKRLKANEKTRDIPVIFLTAKVETEDVVQGFELGAVDYVTKPFNSTELLARVRTHLELRQLQKNLEQLVAERTEELALTNAANQRFVPQEFLRTLGRENIRDIQLGDHGQDMVMTILFSDIVAFTSLAEQMDPDANFRFINSYLSNVSPVIREHCGFIDKYMGDGIIAIFPGLPDDAVRAAVAMQEKVKDYNEGRERAGYEQIRIGVGLHTGNLRLGVIGEQERMDTSVISDSVNVASRMEGLTRRYEAGIIISEQTLAGMERAFTCRRLDRVLVKGKKEVLEIYEVIDGDLEEERSSLKAKTRDDLEAAQDLYYERKFTEANLRIAGVLAANPTDKVVQLYQQRIVLMITQEVPEGWTGVEVLTEK